ncbi:hypothetical protein GCM10020255_008090 [Rhodococcus baikonurensis]
MGLTAAQRNRVLALLDEDDLTLTLPSDMTPDERKTIFNRGRRRHVSCRTPSKTSAMAATEQQ